MDFYFSLHVTDQVRSVCALLGAAATLAHQTSKGAFALDFPQVDEKGVPHNPETGKRHHAPLGTQLAFFGSQEVLKRIRGAIDERFSENGMVEMTGIRPVPANPKHWRQVSGVTVEPNRQKVLDRLVNHFKKKGLPVPKDLEVRDYRPALPHIDLYSLSTNKTMRRYIRISKVAAGREGGFNSYGLSSGGVVPALG